MYARTTTTLAILLAATPALAQPSAPPAQPQPPYPQQPAPAPAPQPYPQQYPQQYPPPQQPYAYPPPPYGYAPPPAPAYQDMAPPDGDLEVVADFALLGVLGSVTLIDQRDMSDEGFGTMLVMAGAAGGAGAGFLLADKLHPSRADGHATTLGLGLGMANAALLLVPMDLDDSSEEVLPALLVGGTVGAIGGLALSRGMELTSGQATFATNLSLLGLGTSAIASALLDTDGEFDGTEMGTLAIGLDGGAAAGILLAPKVDWSYRRARTVGIASMVGFMCGSLIATAVSNGENSDGTSSGDPDPDAVAGGLLVGMWGGFLLGAKLTSGWAPDPKYAQRRNPVAIAPLASTSHVGVSIGGTF